MSSATPIAKPSSSMAIPSRIQNPRTGQYIPLSSTPGGSLYGTTPGGTRIQYDRSALLGYRNSPLSKSPALIPQAIINLGIVDGANAQAIPESAEGEAAAEAEEKEIKLNKTDEHEEELFEME